MRDVEQAAVIETARAHAPDLYLSAVMGPRASREGLLVLAAFEGDVARICRRVSEPMLAEIRLQWWRDVIGAVAEGGGERRTGNPVADALMPLIAGGAVPGSSLMASLEARSSDLSGEDIVDESSLLRYLDAVDGAALARALALASPEAERGDSALLAAGRAVGRTRLLLEAARQHAAGRFTPIELPSADFGSDAPDASGPLSAIRQMAVARAEVETAAPAFRALSRQGRAALAPLALVGPYLQALQRHGFHAQRPAGVITPLSRFYHLWAGIALGRVARR